MSPSHDSQDQPDDVPGPAAAADDGAGEPPLTKRLQAADRRATRWFSGAGTRTPTDELAALVTELSSADDDETKMWDRYGEGGPVEAVETQVAGLLAKPAAAMFPSGVMAQQSVLRVWCDREGSRRVALPELSHLLHHELDGPRLLHGFRFELLSTGAELPERATLAAVPGPLGAVLLELPLRDAGYLLPSWDELCDLVALCRERGVPLHFDGARLWESAPHLGRSLSEIAALADSVYVSFYKGLGGLAGAAVAGPEDIVAEARRWRQRMGGTLLTMQPYAVSALRGLRNELPRMTEYYERAVALAERLPEAGFTVSPTPPHVNAFRLFAPVEAEVILARLVRYAEAERTIVTWPWRGADVPGWAWTEVTVGPATMTWTVEEAVALLTDVVLKD